MLFNFHKPFFHDLARLTAVNVGFDKENQFYRLCKNKAGYTATEVVCGWAGAIFEVTRPFG